MRLMIGSSVWFCSTDTAFWKTGNFLTDRVMVFSRRTLLYWVNSLHLSSAFPLRKFRVPSLVGYYDPDSFHHHRIEKDNMLLVLYKANVLFIRSLITRTGQSFCKSLSYNFFYLNLFKKIGNILLELYSKRVNATNFTNFWRRAINLNFN